VTKNFEVKLRDEISGAPVHVIPAAYHDTGKEHGLQQPPARQRVDVRKNVSATMCFNEKGRHSRRSTGPEATVSINKGMMRG